MNNKPLDTTNSLANGKFIFTSTINTNLHYHKQIEMIYLYKGSLTISTDKEEFHLKTGDAIVLKPFELHKLTPLEKNSYLLIVLPENISLKLLANNLFESKQFCTLDKKTKQLLSLYKTFTSLDSEYERIYYEIVLEIIKHLYNITNQTDISVKILNYINANFTTNITLDSVAKACLTNRTYISNTINKSTGLHFNAYINKLRIARFLDIYQQNKNITIEEVSIICGFSNVRSFYRAFSEELHCTPSEYFGQIKLH